MPAGTPKFRNVHVVHLDAGLGVHLLRGLDRELLELQLARLEVLGEVVNRPAALQLLPQRRQ
eukprot:11214765-Alexandrium_andersonii.AAC.1